MTDVRVSRWRGRRTLSAMVFVVAAALAVGLSPAGAASVTETLRVSVNVSWMGTDTNGGSYSPSISADGRFVAFHSAASNLIVNDTNNFSDVFVYDRSTDSTRRVSVSSTGAQGNAHSFNPSISADGRLVAFQSGANFTEGDTNSTDDVFVRNRSTHTTRRVSVSSTGELGNGASSNPSISADGRFVAFYSSATNLVASDTNKSMDVFVYDRWTHTTRRISVSSTGRQANGASYQPSISAHGRFIAFYSDATNLVGTDSNSRSDVFVFDRTTGTTRRISVSSTGKQGNNDSANPAISADGRFVAFYSDASNLVGADTNALRDVFVYNRSTHTTRRVSVSSTGTQGDGGSANPSISAHGRFVTFVSIASNLVDTDTNAVTDVFVHDRFTHSTQRVSVSSAGMQGDSDSYDTSISADGRFVAFESYATNLVPNDTNLATDVFVRGPLH